MNSGNVTAKPLPIADEALEQSIPTNRHHWVSDEEIVSAPFPVVARNTSINASNNESGERYGTVKFEGGAPVQAQQNLPVPDAMPSASLRESAFPRNIDYGIPHHLIATSNHNGFVYLPHPITRARSFMPDLAPVWTPHQPQISTQFYCTTLPHLSYFSRSQVPGQSTIVPGTTTMSPAGPSFENAPAVANITRQAQTKVYAPVSYRLQSYPSPPPIFLPLELLAGQSDLTQPTVQPLRCNAAHDRKRCRNEEQNLLEQDRLLKAMRQEIDQARIAAIPISSYHDVEGLDSQQRRNFVNIQPRPPSPSCATVDQICHDAGRFQEDREAILVLPEDKKCLALPCDKEKFTAPICFVRKHLLEIFVSQYSKKEEYCGSDEKKASIMRSNGTHFPGKIGLRCKFCKDLPLSSKDRLACSYFFPTSLSTLYRSANKLQNLHFKECSSIPAEIKDKWENMKEECKTKGRGNRCWIESAQKLGLEDKTSEDGKPIGIFFSIQLRPNKELKICQQE